MAEQRSSTDCHRTFEEGKYTWEKDYQWSHDLEYCNQLIPKIAHIGTLQVGPPQPRSASSSFYTLPLQWSPLRLRLPLPCHMLGHALKTGTHDWRRRSLQASQKPVQQTAAAVLAPAAAPVRNNSHSVMLLLLAPCQPCPLCSTAASRPLMSPSTFWSLHSDRPVSM